MSSDYFYYGLFFMLYSIAISVYLVLKAYKRFVKKVTLVVIIIQVLFSFGLFVMRGFPYIHPLFVIYFQTIWFIYINCTIYHPKLR